MRALLTSLCAAALLAALPLAASAHEGHDHGKKKVLGTVAAFHADASHLEVKDAKGVTVGVHVDAATKYVHAGKAVDATHLKPGTRVVVEYRTEADKKIATEIKLGGGKTAPAGLK